MKRWIGAFAAAGLAAASGMVTTGTAKASTDWYQTYQVNVSGSFSDIAAISKTDIWAVGILDKGSKTVYQPFIRHYDGTGWRTVTIPGASGFTSDWVAASGPDNVWVGGLIDSSAATTRIYRYDGSAWHKVPVPGGYTEFQSPVVLGTKSVWVYGSTTSGVYGDVFHWTGAKWHAYDVNTLRFIPQSLAASAWNNVWMTGMEWVGSKEQAFTYRWNGSAWHSVASPHPVVDFGPVLTVTSPGDVWLGYESPTALHALHWDGSHWHTVTAPFYADTYNIVADGQGGYWFGDGAILTGNKWTSEPTPEVTGGFESVVRIPGTESFLQPAGVENSGSSIFRPTIFRFDL